MGMKAPVWIGCIVAGAVIGAGLQTIGNAPGEAGGLAFSGPAAAMDNRAGDDAKAEPADPPEVTFAALEKDGSIPDLIAALRQISQMTSEEIQAAMDEVIKSREHPLKPHLIAAWVERDAYAASRYFLIHQGHWQEDLRAFFKEWTRKSPEAALAAALRLNSDRSQTEVLRQVLTEMSSRNPARAYQMLRSTELTAPRSTFYNSLFDEWVQVDARGAKAAIEQMGAGAGREAAMRAYFRGLATLDPSLAASEAHVLPPGPEKEAAFGSILHQWLNEDEDGAFGFLASLSESPENTGFLTDLSRHAVQVNPQRTLDWALEHLGGERQLEIACNAITRMAESDPSGAAEALKRIPYGRAHDTALLGLSYNWGQQDPLAAMQWAQALSDKSDRRHAVHSVSSQFARFDPNGALAFAANMPDSYEYRIIVEAVGREKARSNPQAALDWVGTLGDDTRDTVRHAVLIAWGTQDPPALAGYLASEAPDALTPNLAYRFAREWSQRDAGAATHWAASLPDSQSQIRAVGIAINEWLQQDTYAASVWVETLPAGPVREEAVARVVSRITEAAPDSAFAWATQLQTPGRRMEMLRSVITRWREHAPEAAGSALQFSGLPAGEKAELLRLLTE